MEQPNHTTKLQTILNLTQLMLQNAKQERWEGVMDTQQQRDALMTDFFNDSKSLANDYLAEHIREIMTLDKETMSLGMQSHKSMQDELNKISKGRKAVHAYKQV
jgi:hypothetical protein